MRYLCQNRPKIGPEHPPRPPESSISPQLLAAAYSYNIVTACIKKIACPNFGSVTEEHNNDSKYCLWSLINGVSFDFDKSMTARVIVLGLVFVR